MATLTVRVTLSALLGTDPPHPIPQSMSLSLCLSFLLSPARVGSERCYETGPTKFVLCREDWNAYRTICRYGTRQQVQLIYFFKPKCWSGPTVPKSDAQLVELTSRWSRCFVPICLFFLCISLEGTYRGAPRENGETQKRAEETKRQGIVVARGKRQVEAGTTTMSNFNS